MCRRNYTWGLILFSVTGISWESWNVSPVGEGVTVLYLSPSDAESPLEK